MRGSPEKGELWDDKKGSMSYLFFIFLQLPSTMLRIQIGIPIKAVLNCSGDLILLFGGEGRPLPQFPHLTTKACSFGLREIRKNWGREKEIDMFYCPKLLYYYYFLNT